jgi:hypothetical protein
MAATMTIDNDTLVSNNGTLTDLTLDVDADITWNGAENEPGDTDCIVEIDHDGSWEEIGRTNATLTGLAGTWTPEIKGMDILTESSWKRSDFNASGDGTSQSVDLTVRLRIATTGDLDGNGKTSFTSSGSEFTITVENQPNSNNAGGSGTPNADGPNKGPSDNNQ